MSEQLDEFDWVSARAQCTPFAVFEKLRAQVKVDMERRNSLMRDGDLASPFSLGTGPEWFSVSSKTLDKYRGVTFTLTANGVAVHDATSHTKICDAALMISDEGHCVLRVGSTELKFWQFRKLALQDLFFIVDKAAL
jgi:hypothetical protein